jgi:hypothetical protein
LIKKWLVKEIGYGTTQREYIRAWLSYLSGERVKYSEQALTKPVKGGEAWKRNLIGDLGAALWKKVVLSQDWESAGKFDLGEIWKADPKQTPDLRFTNLNRIPPTLAKKRVQALRADEAKFAALQQICQHRFHSVDPDQVEKIKEAFDSGEYAKLSRLLAKQERIAVDPDEPRDVFVLA